MFVKIPITYKTLTEKFKITKRSDGRYCCRIPISYETTADGKKTYQYKTIYMEQYIKVHDDADRSILKVFYQLRGLDENGKKVELAAAASFGELRMWFLNQYPEVEDMNATVDNILEKARKERAEKKAKAMEAKAALAFVR